MTAYRGEEAIQKANKISEKFGLGIAVALFYRIKLKEPIELLRGGTEYIRATNFGFSISTVSKGELGQICAAFDEVILDATGSVTIKLLPCEGWLFTVIVP